MNSKAFPDLAGFPNYVDTSGRIYADRKGMFVMKKSDGDHREYDAKPGEKESVQYEYQNLKFLSSICPEFTTAPVALTRVPTKEERERGKLFNPQHKPQAYTHWTHTTTIFMPLVQNASMIADLIKNVSCSEYDVLVCIQQALLVVLCIGNGMKLDDMHNENVMISKSATYVTQDGLIERPPKITFIDAGGHKLNLDDQNIDSFLDNMVSVFEVICQIILTCNFSNTLPGNFNPSWKNEHVFNKILFSEKYMNEDDNAEVQLKKAISFFVENIYTPLKSGLEQLQMITNIASAEKEFHHSRSRRFHHSDIPATEVWRQNRINVISHLKTRIDYLVDKRISQLSNDEHLKPISTWELDSLLEERSMKKIRN